MIDFCTNYFDTGINESIKTCTDYTFTLNDHLY